MMDSSLNKSNKLIENHPKSIDLAQSFFLFFGI